MKMEIPRALILVNHVPPAPLPVFSLPVAPRDDVLWTAHVHTSVGLSLPLSASFWGPGSFTEPDPTVVDILAD